MTATEDSSSSGVANIGIVVIGRNEGDRLVECIKSLISQSDRIVYVDSGSADQSVKNARELGALVVELDTAIPFTAARARNAGFEALVNEWPSLPYVQFWDGDCIMEANWCEHAVAALDDDADLTVVTGWYREQNADATIYNMMMEIEWGKATGEIVACAGNMAVRTQAYKRLGGFDPNVIAAEDDEFCIRARIAGGKIKRLPINMAIHDAKMDRFVQWWRRAVRSGHGFAQVGDLHQDYYIRERLRVIVWGLLLPAGAAAFLFIYPIAGLAILALYPLSFISTRRNLVRQKAATGQNATIFAAFLTISKVPNVIGLLKYWLRKLFRRRFTIIEYK